MPNILIVDDEPTIIDVIQERLEAEGFACHAAMGSWEVQSLLRDARPDLALVDINLGHENGLEILKQVRHGFPGLPVIIMTGYPNSELCLEAMRLGAEKFIRKPLDLDELALLARRLTDPKGQPQSGAHPEDAFVCKSQVMLDLTQAVWKAAQNQADTLILGPSGTGKDLAARLIHRHGPRNLKPFYTIYMPTISATLFESELFGHEANAFTGAKSKKGRVEEAEGGVLLLNEIGEMSLEQQAKLLEFLGEKSYVRVGGNERRVADVQILACTNRNLEEAVREGFFRSDLYYRLQANVIRIPALREHAEDIPDLVDHFIRMYRGGKPIQGLDPELLAEFQGRAWDGNVRELELCVRQGVQHCPERLIRRADIPSLAAPDRHAEGGLSAEHWDMTWDEFQSRLDQLACQFLRYHLKQHQGKVTEAARGLGLSRETLQYKIKTLGIKNAD